MWSLVVATSLIFSYADCHSFQIYTFENALKVISKAPYILPLTENISFINTMKDVFINAPYQHFMFASLKNQCSHDIYLLFQGLLARKPWALQWVDASAHAPAGITGGAINWNGNYELCLNSSGIDDHGKIFFRGRYCQMSIKLIDIVLPIGMNMGVCMPDSCTTDDIMAIAETISSQLSLNMMKENTFCHKSADEMDKDGWYYVALILCFTLLSLVLLATLVDSGLYLRWYFAIRRYSVNAQKREVNICQNNSIIKQCNVHTGSESPVTYNKYRAEFLRTHKVTQLLCAYSLPYNTWKLWTSKSTQILHKHGKQKDHPLTFLDGIRFITMLWIIFGHLFAFGILVSNNALIYIQKAAHRWTFDVMITATLSVDTFFFMSGLLTCYLGLVRLKNVRTIREKIKFWTLFIIHRVLRITPAYLLVLIAYTGLYIHSYDGPFFPQDPKVSDIHFCRKRWYVTYLNNFLYLKESCMVWAWYLANDMQFSLVLAPIFMTLIMWSQAVGTIFAFLLIAVSSIVTFCISYQQKFDVLGLDENSVEQVYIKPYTRWGTYSIGMYLGWLLCTYPKLSIKRTRWNAILIPTCCLCVASLLCLSTVYGLDGSITDTHFDIGVLPSALYNALSRPAFIIGVAIVAYLVATGWAEPIRALLSWSGFRVPARLTYGAYLVHPIIIFFTTSTAQVPLMYDNVFLIQKFLAILVLSYAGAFIVAMVAESPVLILEKYIFGSLR